MAATDARLLGVGMWRPQAPGGWFHHVTAAIKGCGRMGGVFTWGSGLPCLCGWLRCGGRGVQWLSEGIRF